MLALGVELLFNKDGEFTAHSCALDDSKTDKNVVCSKCKLKDLVDCTDNKEIYNIYLTIKKEEYHEF